MRVLLRLCESRYMRALVCLLDDHDLEPVCDPRYQVVIGGRCRRCGVAMPVRSRHAIENAINRFASGASPQEQSETADSPDTRRRR
jgi:hypothetical protein